MWDRIKKVINSDELVTINIKGEERTGMSIAGLSDVFGVIKKKKDEVKKKMEEEEIRIIRNVLAQIKAEIRMIKKDNNIYSKEFNKINNRLRKLEEKNT